MKRGLVIGKFLPVHIGHISLIHFAVNLCDELIVSMSYTDADEIDPQIRFQWISKIFSNSKKIKCFIIKDDFDNETLPLEKRTKIWADVITKTYPSITHVISSEEYGFSFAKHLGAEHICFDPERSKIPVSATLIRKHPFRYWQFIPEIVRPHFVKKVCFYGPESTGKSTFTKMMAQRFKTNFVPEVAREMLHSNDFNSEKIIDIAIAHDKRVCEEVAIANKILFCDTDVITTQIYSRHYLESIPDILFQIENSTKYDLYFLMDIDVPWVEDPLRDLGNQRLEMLEIFKTELVKRNLPFVIISGNYEQREQAILLALKNNFADIHAQRDEML